MRLFGVGRHDDEHRGGAVPTAGDAAVDVGEQVGRHPGGGIVAPAIHPRALGDIVDADAECLVPHDDEHPRLAVLRARRVRGRFEHARDQIVIKGRILEVATRALVADDLEEIDHAVRSPRRRNVFTYMIRSASWRAQRSKPGVPHAPIRCPTSGVIDLNATSGSSVSIS